MLLTLMNFPRKKARRIKKKINSLHYSGMDYLFLPPSMQVQEINRHTCTQTFTVHWFTTFRWLILICLKVFYLLMMAHFFYAHCLIEMAVFLLIVSIFPQTSRAGLWTAGDHPCCGTGIAGGGWGSPVVRAEWERGARGRCGQGRGGPPGPPGPWQSSMNGWNFVIVPLMK